MPVPEIPTPPVPPVVPPAPVVPPLTVKVKGGSKMGAVVYIAAVLILVGVTVYILTSEKE